MISTMVLTFLKAGRIALLDGMKGKERSGREEGERGAGGGRRRKRTSGRARMRGVKEFSLQGARGVRLEDREQIRRSTEAKQSIYDRIDVRRDEGRDTGGKGKGKDEKITTIIQRINKLLLLILKGSVN